MKQIKLYLLVLGMLNLAMGADNVVWKRVDCTYKNNIESLFEHCSPLEQEFIEEAMEECGVENWEKLQKWVNCGAPQSAIINNYDIPKAYKVFIKSKNRAVYFEELPMQSIKKVIDNDLFIHYQWKTSKHLQIIFGYDLHTQCDYIHFFDLGNGSVKIVKGDMLMCDKLYSL
ncbi:hypothetical protein LS70_009755 [Helicobacter sp. MIT 11-5569]|uniref:hypothetical protein n=1 Tax=Helicobacter sp. MIT 11-5569 TaxID=1548151 RepID=UPI00051F94D7|nr:hypothetical protein [Helicobacter sp. MIT 11-5569]TLD79699.1 hypothetical protein LS70_009755 [Helicobacter sp. MIT 11-5569]